MSDTIETPKCRQSKNRKLIHLVRVPESQSSAASPTPPSSISLFLLLLVAVEVGTRLTMDHVSSLDLFVVTSQQKAQVADAKQSGIFEGDPLLLWRLKPNLDHVVWDFTVLSTNAATPALREIRQTADSQSNRERFALSVSAIR